MSWFSSDVSAGDDILASDLNNVIKDIKEWEAGDELIMYADGQESTDYASPTLVKEFVIGKGGELRIKFDLIGATGSPVAHSAGQIYRNGSPVGTLRSTTNLSWVTYSEDISGWSPGDLVQLYVYDINGTGGGVGACRNFRMYGNISDVTWRTNA
jgi:hypothetical protein